MAFERHRATRRAIIQTKCLLGVSHRYASSVCLSQVCPSSVFLQYVTLVGLISKSLKYVLPVCLSNMPLQYVTSVCLTGRPLCCLSSMASPRVLQICISMNAIECVRRHHRHFVSHIDHISNQAEPTFRSLTLPIGVCQAACLPAKPVPTRFGKLF